MSTLETYICEKADDRVVSVIRYKSLSKMEEVAVDLDETPINEYVNKRYQIAHKWLSEGCPEGTTYWYDENYSINSVRLKECTNHEYKDGVCIHCGKKRSDMKK
jgi:predicted secreted acid phosphatase